MSLQYQENVPLAPLTTFRVGGKAAKFIEVNNQQEVRAVFEDNSADSVFVLGGGSNVLISDHGIDGVVLKIGIQGIEFEDLGGGRVRVTAGAGEDWDRFVGVCVDKELAGVECLSGIPGLVGGTPIQNVGAYGQDVSETMYSVSVFDRLNGESFKMSNADCDFAYRKSIFNTEEKDRFVVTSVSFDLSYQGTPKIEYRDLKNRFEGRQATLEEVRAAVCEIRRSKGMLVRQGGPDSRSAGSFFKNPIVDETGLNDVAAVLGLSIDDVPYFDVGEGAYKVPAAWLIEQSGFEKGFRKGNAGISDVHALALTNRGGATASEIIELKETVEKGVFEKFGIRLVNEPNLVGF